MHGFGLMMVVWEHWWMDPKWRMQKKKEQTLNEEEEEVQGGSFSSGGGSYEIGIEENVTAICLSPPMHTLTTSPPSKSAPPAVLLQVPFLWAAARS